MPWTRAGCSGFGQYPFRASHRRYARASCLGVLGFRRPPICQPLAFCAADREHGAFRIFDAQP